MAVFTATDGTQFTDRNAWRRYEFETNYTFRNKQKQTLVKVPGSIQGQPFDLSDLDECRVLLLDQCDQVQIDNLNNCHVFIGPCSESVFVRNCTNCVFTIACKQLRTRDCSGCTVSLYSLTDPIIETSTGMQFAPFNGAYAGIQQHFSDARLEPNNNHWSQVYDFNDPDKTGVNWSLLKPEQAGPAWVVAVEDHGCDVSSLGECVNPVARDSGFIQYTESGPSTGGMQSFSFKTTQQVAQQTLENQNQPLPPAPCLAQEPAAVLVDIPLAPPPAPVMQTTPLEPLQPPVAPASVPSVESVMKLAVVEAAEPLTPPLTAVVGSDSTNQSESAAKACDSVDKATEMLQTLTHADPTPVMPS